jgi:hypothetical protein
MIAYFGEVIKMSANISYIMMTLNRYLLIGKDHHLWLVIIAKLEFKWVICGILLFSGLFNIGHGWEYQAVKDLAISKSYIDYFDTSAGVNGISYSDYPYANQGQGYLIYSIVYFVMNFGMFFILSTGIEVAIVRRMHTELKERRVRRAQMTETKSSTSLAENTPQTEEDKKREREDWKKEQKVIKMVVFNSILSFILRVPEMLFWMENDSIWQFLLKDNHFTSQTHKTFMPGLLSLIADIGYFTYIVTFTTNFVIYYKFNKNFKEAVVFF